MPHLRLPLPALRLPRSPFSPARPGGRWFGLALVGTGMLLLAVAAAPVLVGAQSTDSFGNGPHDPGVRGGPKGAGGMIAGLDANQRALFTSTRDTFQEVDSVLGESRIPDTGTGLGPRFNMDSCSGCHAQPDVGGTSPFVNPQIAVAHKEGATNAEDLSSFIKINGPVREVRFKANQDTSPDGGVKDLFTISGRSDAAGCNILQPDFNAALAANNAIFRIPTPTFGLGLIESISDSTIINGALDQSAAKARLGITGRANHESNAGTVTRFGWKAQNKLEIFAGEAYNVEQGVSNELFPNEREEARGCVFNGSPEDHTDFATGEASDTVQFAIFMRFLAPPSPGPSSTSTRSGQDLFADVGCALCHTPQLRTGKSSVAALDNKPVNLYSDLLLHNMGADLDDGISQGVAVGNEFRTAPLWGLGKRIFFLHDGRTNNLITAINAHASAGSEANGVIRNFNRLGTTQKQDILNFLRSL